MEPGRPAVSRSPPDPHTLDELVAPRLVAIMANVRDPGNAGTVIRAADAAVRDAAV